MPVGAKLRVGAEEFELRRLRPPRRRRESVTTSPEMAHPTGAIVADPSSPDAATRHDSPVDMVYDQVIALLDERRVEDARRFVDPLLGLLELGHRPLTGPALERVAVLVLCFVEVSREGRYLDWIVSEHRRRAALMSARAVDLLERVLFAGVEADGTLFEAYLAALSELGLCRTPDERALRDRIRDAASARGFTVPAPPRLE
jgi:hypothetical protein